MESDDNLDDQAASHTRGALTDTLSSGECSGAAKSREALETLTAAEADTLEAIVAA